MIMRIRPHCWIFSEHGDKRRLTGMTGTEDRDWPVLDPAFGLAERLSCDGIWFKHGTGVEFLTQGAESARRCRELARDPAWEPA